jgi:hypothetical protein
VASAANKPAVASVAAATNAPIRLGSLSDFI